MVAGYNGSENVGARVPVVRVLSCGLSSFCAVLAFSGQQQRQIISSDTRGGAGRLQSRYVPDRLVGSLIFANVRLILCCQFNVVGKHRTGKLDRCDEDFLESSAFYFERAVLHN